MTNLVRVRALQRRPLRIAGNIISTSGDGTVLDLDAPRVAQELRAIQSYPFSKTRVIVTGADTAGADAGGHTFPSNKAKDELTYVKGGILWQAIELPAGQTITSVAFYSGATALNTGTHQYVGLYKLNDAGTLLTRVAVTADDTSGAWAASSAKAFSFTAPYKTVGGGTYYIALLVTGTTAPTLVGRKPFSAKIANIDGVATGSYEYETALTGNNNDLRFVSTFSDAQITYSYTAAAGAESVLTTDHSVVVTLAVDVDNTTILSTGATIKATILADAPSAAVLTPDHAPGNDGTGAVTSMTIKTVAAQTLPAIAVSGQSLTSLPSTLATTALVASNLEAFATFA